MTIQCLNKVKKHIILPSSLRCILFPSSELEKVKKKNAPPTINGHQSPVIWYHISEREDYEYEQEIFVVQCRKQIYR